MLEYIKVCIQDSIDTKRRLAEDEALAKKIEQVAEICVNAFRNGSKVMACGNGGSASDAQHLVGELVGRYKIERDGIPAIALNSNVAVMTALGNDYNYDYIFSKQVKALGSTGDVLFGISTSGNSANIIRAFEQAKKQGIYTVSLTGSKGGRLKDISDCNINVPSDDTPRIQEAHILVIHTVCGLVERELYNTGYFEETDNE